MQDAALCSKPMKCPYCLVHFHSDTGWARQPIGFDEDKQQWVVQTINCPSCRKLIVMLRLPNGPSIMVLPRSLSRSPLGPEVVDPYRSDYLEACAVFPDSAKA